MRNKKSYVTILFTSLSVFLCMAAASNAQTTPDPTADLVGVPSSGFDVKGTDISPKSLPPMVTTTLGHASCYNKPGGFSIVETDRVEEMLDEIDLSNSEAGNPSTRMQNRIFPPNKLVGGKWDSDGKNMTITLWLKDTNGKILLSRSKSGPLENFSEITDNVSKDLADAMCKTKNEPTNRWVGTISYEHTKKNESKSRSSYVLGDGIDSTGKTYSYLSVNIRIGSTGTPQAFIVSKSGIISEEIATGKINCGKVKGWRSTAFHKKSTMEGKGVVNANASVSVSARKSFYEISIGISEIKTTTTFSESMHDDGGCAEPYDKNPPPFVRTESIPVLVPSSIVQNIPLKNQNELSGSKKIPNAGTITWNLKQTPIKTNPVSGIKNQH
jgi:hypothetical protein